MEYVIYWFHFSTLSSNGHKAKCKVFKNAEEALRLYEKLKNCEEDKKPYQQGIPKNIAKNF